MRSIILIALAIASLLHTSQALAADSMEPTPRELEKVTVVEKLGSKLPLDIPLLGIDGKETSLKQLMGPRPIILTFNYSSCPLLCSTQLGGLVDGMRKLEWSIGKEFDVITISLDSNEEAATTRETREGYLERYKRDGQNWHFVRGSAESVRSIADAVGFGYTFHKGRKEYLHPAVIMLVSPFGTLSGYMYGTMYQPQELQNKLISAAASEISESLERFIHSCYLYRKPTGNGAVVASVMRYGGLLFIVGFAIAMAVYSIRRSSRDEATFHQVGSPKDHV